MNPNRKRLQVNAIGSIFINDDPRMPAEILIVVEQENNEPSCTGCF